MELGTRTIDDYSFLPPATVGPKPPGPPRIGWSADPFSGFGERLHDGSRWTQCRAMWSRWSGQRLFLAGFGPLCVHVVRMAFPPKSLGRTDSTNVLYAGVLVIIFGAGLLAVHDPVLRALWLR